MQRRKMIKGLTLLPLAASLLPLQSLASTTAGRSTGLAEGLESAASGPLEIGPRIFQSIGVEPIINCRGTFTIIGGSIERPEVRAAMEASSKDFVQYDELAMGIGQRLADLSGAEWGMVSAGCAAGLKHVTASCITGGDPEKLVRIPDLTGFEKSEVIIPRSARNVYDHAIRNIGVRIITVNTVEELSNAICSRTALIYLMADEPSDKPQPLSLEAVAAIAKPKNIPVLVDAAAEILTIPNRHLQRGATVVAYSGGKAICGPQCAGLLLGSKPILMAAWQASSPHHGPGRDNKVGREEMIGMLAAVEAWAKRDHSAEWKTWLDWLSTISKKVTSIAGVTTLVFEPKEFSNRSPVLKISWDPAKLNITAEEIAEVVGRNKPRIAIGAASNGTTTTLSITTGQMQAGNEKIVAERLYAILAEKRSPKSTEMAAAATSVTGSWEAAVQFFNGSGIHTLFIEQDGNWLKGFHKGAFSTRELTGTIIGDKVKLKSIDRNIGDSITFIFSGTIQGDTISGPIHMGEYMTANFTAKRTSYRGKHEQIVVPGGPPLAT